MNLKQLEIFVRVAETKNFSAAARQLYLTQPTVSAHIAALERELNTCLLVRNTKGVALSETGKELYAYAEQMLDLEQQIRLRFGLEGGQKGCVLRIAASTVPSQYLLPEMMAQFRVRYPGEKLKVLETDSAGVVDLILSHKADIGFTGTVLDKGNCTYIPFYRDELVLIAPASAKYQEMRNQKELSWIREEPFILREEGSGTRKEAEKMLARIGIAAEDLCVAAVMENPETIKRSVACGIGISILSRLAAAQEADRGDLITFPLGEAGGERDIHLVYDAGYPQLPAAERFVEEVRDMYRLGKAPSEQVY